MSIELMSLVIAKVGGDVSNLPDNLRTTQLKALCEALGIDTSGMTDNLESSYLRKIIAEYKPSGGTNTDEETPEEPTPDVPVEPSGIVWSETAEYNIDHSTGEVVAGDQYVSEMFALENGYVYELKQPTGGSWIGIAAYDANGTFKYHIGISRDGDLYLDGFDIGYIRIHVYPNSPDELDLSTVVPVNTGRIWSVNKYLIDSSTGVITLNERNNYITLQKIPVEGGATYKLSTSGTHQYLSWYEYTENGTYLGYKGNQANPKELEALVSQNTAYVVLSMHGGELPCDDYVTFIKTADAS